MPGGGYPRQAEHVYRVRRAIAATIFVLVLYGLWRLVSSFTADEETAPPPTTAPTTTTTLPPPPDCAEGDVVVAQDPDEAWSTIMIDTERSLPPDYGPGDLRNIADAGFPLTDGQAVRALVVEDLSALREAAADNGTPLGILASYRSYVQQADLYERRIDELGASEAGSRVARPGHSEHQLGTTIDVTDEGATDVDQSWGASPAGQWVASNAHKFGFLLSYPSNAQPRTCYDFEPWHLRYVGREQAAAVIESGLTLREYLWDLEQQAALAAPTTTTTAAG
jgi:D-alanyl-D-alanine carboxypeptidase